MGATVTRRDLVGAELRAACAAYLRGHDTDFDEHISRIRALRAGIKVGHP